jgi:hypothetical protein
VKSNNLAEQTKLLRAPSNRRKIQDVMDDSSSIRTARSQKASTISSMRSSNGRTLLLNKEFDGESLNSDANQHAMRHGRSVSDSAQRQHSRQPRLHVQTPDQNPFDEGYATMSQTTTESTSSSSHRKSIAFCQTVLLMSVVYVY